MHLRKHLTHLGKRSMSPVHVCSVLRAANFTMYNVQHTSGFINHHLIEVTLAQSGSRCVSDPVPEGVSTLLFRAASGQSTGPRVTLTNLKPDILERSWHDMAITSNTRFALLFAFVMYSSSYYYYYILEHTHYATEMKLKQQPRMLSYRFVVLACVVSSVMHILHCCILLGCCPES